MGTVGRDDLGMRAVRIHRQDAAAAQVEKKQPAGAGRARCGFCLRGMEYGHGLSFRVASLAPDYSAASGFGRLVKLGGRFSRNAVKASVASAEWTRSLNSRLSSLDGRFELVDRSLLEEPLDGAQRAGRFCRELLRRCRCCREQTAIGHHAGHEAQLGRPRGREGLAQQEHFCRPEMPDARRHRKARSELRHQCRDR